MTLAYKIVQTCVDRGNAALPRLAGAMDTSIAFIHMPKCGGTSIHSAISEHYRPDKVSYLDPIASRLAAEATNIPMLPFRRSLLAYELGIEDGAKFISGHWPVDQDLIETNAEHWAFVTILRDPVERWLSNYFFNRHRQDNREHFGTGLDLEAYLDTTDAVENGKLYLSFAHGGDMPTHDLANKITQAIDVYKSFALVGTLDQMDIFLSEFKKRWNTQLTIPTSNENPVSKLERDEALTPAHLRQIKELCAPDQAIYDAFRSNRK